MYLAASGKISTSGKKSKTFINPASLPGPSSAKQEPPTILVPSLLILTDSPQKALLLVPPSISVLN